MSANGVKGFLQREKLTKVSLCLIVGQRRRPLSFLSFELKIILKTGNYLHLSSLVW